MSFIFLTLAGQYGVGQKGRKMVRYETTSDQVSVVDYDRSEWKLGSAWRVGSDWVLLWKCGDEYLFKYKKLRIPVNDEAIKILYRDGCFFSEFRIESSEDVVFVKRYFNIQGLHNPFIGNGMRDEYDPWFCIYRNLLEIGKTDQWKRFPFRLSGEGQVVEMKNDNNSEI